MSLTEAQSVIVHRDWRPKPEKLWSLLEMIEELRELAFLFEKAKMLERDLPSLGQSDEVIAGGKEMVIRGELERLVEPCLRHGFEHSIAAIDRIRQKLPILTFAQLKQRLNDLLEDFVLDCKGREAYVIDADKSQYYQAGFGDIVDDAFWTAKEEIIEGNRCYAIGANTACVFHMMRAVECGARTLAVAVGVTSPKLPLEYQEWNALIEQIASRSKVAVDAWGKCAEQTNARQFFSRIIGDLQSFKDDVRNVTMHTRKTYDAPGALSVRNRTEEWFKLLATKVSEEDPTPTVLDKSLFAP